MPYFYLFVAAFRSLFLAATALRLENLALRQQLAILQHQSKRPRLKNRDRCFWIVLSRLFDGWKSCLVIANPDTVIRWHRAGFRCVVGYSWFHDLPTRWVTEYAGSRNSPHMWVMASGRSSSE